MLYSTKYSLGFHTLPHQTRWAGVILIKLNGKLQNIKTDILYISSYQIWLIKLTF